MGEVERLRSDLEEVRRAREDDWIRRGEALFDRGSERVFWGQCGVGVGALLAVVPVIGGDGPWWGGALVAALGAGVWVTGADQRREGVKLLRMWDRSNRRLPDGERAA